MDYNSLNPNDLPYYLEAEQNILGSILVDPNLISSVLEQNVKPESFYLKQHKEIFAIIIKMFTFGAAIDPVTLANEAVNDGVFENSGAANSYLASLMNSVIAFGNITEYCRILNEKYFLRTLISTAQEIIDNATSSGGKAEEILDNAEQKIFDIRQGRETKGLTPIDEVLVETYDEIQKKAGPDKEKFQGAKSGFRDLDTILTGLNKSDLLLIAARPGMGKTSFALNIATNVARNSKKMVAVFSLEMSKQQLALRMLSSEALIDSNNLHTGYLADEDWPRLAAGADMLSKLNIYMDDTPGITVPQMKGELRRHPDLGLVVIDYLQLMSSGRRIDNRVTEVSEITRQLKLMAKELNVPVITLSQLSRGPEARTDHRPILSDLRDSGSIEQDADIVMFLYRDAYYNKDTEEQNISECIVAKNRHGTTGTVKLAWDGQFTRFSGLANPIQ